MKYLLFLTSLLVAFNTFSQTSPLCFSNSNYTNVGIGPQSIISADFNNDGYPDMATGNFGSDSITILINSGNGVNYSRSNYLVGGMPEQVIAADFNIDGILDLAVTNNSVSASNVSSISVLLGTINGLFSSAMSYTVGPSALSLRQGDFNGDGNIDIAVGTGMNIYFLDGFNNGLFSQSYTKPFITISAYDFDAHDYNSDGKTDIAAIDYNNNNNQLQLYISGHGVQIPMFFGANNCMAIKSADFNNDGILDLVTGGDEFLSVLYGASNGVFYPPVTYTINSSINVSTMDVFPYDIDNDGFSDIFVLDGNNFIFIFYGSASGVFTQSAMVFNTGQSSMPWAFTIADFNADGKKDIATVNTGLYNIGVLLNRVQPNVTINASTNSVCIGSGVILQGNGAYTYTWSTGETTALNYQMPNVDVNYSVIGTGINYCVNTQTINVFVDNTCAEVWPGDANSDGRADNLDILELGLHYTQTGAPRASTSNAWQSYFSTSWVGTVTNGKNLNHSDCNGDGTINDNDTLAIYNNYGLTHSFKPAQTNTVNPQLSIVLDQVAVAKGTWGTASVYLGDATNQINTINGIAFTVDFDNTLIETNSIYLEYSPSFIDVSNQNLDFRKLDFANGKIYTATTHTVNNNVSGFGKIATLHYQIKSSLFTDQVLNIGLAQANQSDASGNIVPLTSGTATIMAMGSSVGLIESLNNDLISISPNPTNGLLTVNSKTELQKIDVVSITGQVLLSEVPTSTNHTLHLQNYANGIYFVNMYQNNRIIKREKVVLNK